MGARKALLEQEEEPVATQTALVTWLSDRLNTENSGYNH